MATLTPVTYGDYTYPTWAIVAGWLLAVVSMVPIPIMALYQIYTAQGSLVEVTDMVTLIPLLMCRTEGCAES